MIEMNTCRGVKTLQVFCKTVFILTAFAVLAACGGGKKTTDKTSQTAEKSLPVDAALKQRLVDFASARRPKGNFGVYVYDLTANKLVFADHENLSQPVASNTKLLSGVAALHRLGTRYKYATSLYTRGTISNGLLHGDVIF